MDRIKVHTSRYRAFDITGQLPFSIVFGLCRRSSADTDRRPLVLETAGSALDVPYALAHGLLTLQEGTSKTANGWTEVDTNSLDIGESKTTDYIPLTSPVGRSEPWRDAFTVYKCPLDFSNALATVLEVGRKYPIRLASEDLGVKRWAYGDKQQVKDSFGTSSHDQAEIRLVNSKPTAGNADFKVVQNLPWPPKMKIGLRLCVSSPNLADGSHDPSSASSHQKMEVSVTNQGSDPITVQTWGQQRYLIPWGPFQPEPGIDARWTRIIDPALQGLPFAGLQVTDVATGAVIRGEEQRNSDLLTAPGADMRPRIGDLVTLKSGVPHVKQSDIVTVVKGLADGQYRIRLQPKGCHWWIGNVEDSIGEDGKVLKQFCGSMKPPLMIESEDEFEVRLKDGRIEQPTWVG